MKTRALIDLLSRAGLLAHASIAEMERDPFVAPFLAVAKKCRSSEKRKLVVTTAYCLRGCIAKSCTFHKLVAMLICVLWGVDEDKKTTKEIIATIEKATEEPLRGYRVTRLRQAGIVLLRFPTLFAEIADYMTLVQLYRVPEKYVPQVFDTLTIELTWQQCFECLPYLPDYELERLKAKPRVDIGSLDPAWLIGLPDGWIDRLSKNRRVQIHVVRASRDAQLVPAIEVLRGIKFKVKKPEPKPDAKPDDLEKEAESESEGTDGAAVENAEQAKPKPRPRIPSTFECLPTFIDKAIAEEGGRIPDDLLRGMLELSSAIRDEIEIRNAQGPKTK